MYKLRVGGTNEYVSKIDPDDTTCFPPGSIATVEGIGHEEALGYTNLARARGDQFMAEYLEGCTISLEWYDGPEDPWEE